MTNNDIQTFPQRTPLTCDAHGMTLRDYFAAQAMAALIMEPKWDEGQTSLAIQLGNGKSFVEKCSSAAYVIADAMMESRQP